MTAYIRWAFWRAFAAVYSLWFGARAAIHYRRKAGAIQAGKTRAANRAAASQMTPAPHEDD